MILEALGLDLGDPRAFYGADQWNERGYYEREDVIDINSRILTGFPRTRGAVTSILSQIRYLTMPSQQAIDRRAGRLGDQIAQLAHELRGVAVKDPRFCLTLRAWEPFVSSVVVCLRHPDPVARSLHRRQRIPRKLALRFWDYHAEGLLDLPAEEVLYVDFDALSSREEAREELAAMVSFFSLDVTREGSWRRYEERFEPSLRHFDAASADPLPRRTRELWEELHRRRTAS